jgi:hypothetical protein
MLLRHVETDKISITKEENYKLTDKTIILLTVLYGSESWTLSKAHEVLFGGFERTILRRLYEAVLIDEGW